MIWVRSTANDRQLIYIHVPRNGGASIIKALHEHPEVELVREHLPHQTLNALSFNVTLRALVGIPVVASVRNPLDWLVSQWSLVEHPRNADRHTFHGRWPEFEDYVRNHHQHYHPWRFQADFVTHAIVNPELFLFTSLEHLWRRIEEILGVKLPRVHINQWNEGGRHTPRRHADQVFADFYTGDLVHYARQHYEPDFRLYEDVCFADLAGTAHEGEKT